MNADKLNFLRKQMQLQEALGETNRYYFYEKYGRDPYNDEELVLYYIERGGSNDFAINHPELAYAIS